jgi:hypothetical protein
MKLNLADSFVSLSDDDLLSRLVNFEDNFVERKSSGDKKSDWLKTAVAFANGVPVGYPAVLFLGVKDDGLIEGQANLDSLQKTVSEVLDDAYPPIYYTLKVVSKESKQCLAVIVPGSLLRPHFAGRSFVRVGSQNKQASEAQFAELIAQRNSKAHEILKWRGRQVSVQVPHTGSKFPPYFSAGVGAELPAIVKECNQFFVRLQLIRNISDTPMLSYPLNFVEISYDDQKDCLKILCV